MSDDRPAELSPSQVARLRLQSQRLVPRRAGSPADVVRRLLAVQAQDFAAALWALGLRTSGGSRAAVAAALDRGEVVRTWPMRGTLHFVAPGDLRWMLGLTAPRMLQAFAARHRQLGLDAVTFDRARKTAEAGLAGGGRASRAEFMAMLQDNGIDASGQRGYHIVYALAQTGTLCWGPTDRNQQALVLVDDWVAPAPARPREEALGEFVLRYLAGHGPATLRDFAWWSKLTLADARAGFARVRDELVELSCRGTGYWMTREGFEDSDPDLGAGRRSVLALPAFDELLLGYQDRDVVLPPEHAGRVVPGKNGLFLPVVAAGGRAVGTWRRTAGRDGVLVEPTPFTAFTATARDGFAAAARRYGRFLGEDVRVADLVAPAAAESS